MKKLSVERFVSVVIVGLVALAIVLLPLVALAAPLGAGENGVRDNLTVTTTSFSGVAQTLSAASGDGNKFLNNGEAIVVISNNTGSTITATFVTPATSNGIPLEDVDVAVDNGATKIAGPFPTGVFNQATGADRNYTYINYSAAVTGTTANSVTVGVFKLR